MKSIFTFLTISSFLLSPMAQAFDLTCSVEFYGAGSAYEKFELKDLEIDYFNTELNNFQIHGLVEKDPDLDMISIEFRFLENSMDYVIGVAMIFPENNPNASWQADIPYKQVVVWYDHNNQKQEFMSEIASFNCTVVE